MVEPTRWGRTSRPGREDLYNDFILAASKAYGDALVTNEPHIQEIVALYDMISMMRVLSSPRTVESADKVMQTILDIFFTSNKAPLELRERARSSAALDPPKDFGEAAREELHMFLSL
jgi:hypothetical protein